MAGPAAVLGIDVIANIAEAQAALGKVQAQLEATAATSESAAAKSAAAWTAAGKKMTTAGKAMTKYITLPAVAAGAAAVKLAMDFDKSMALIQTQAGASASEVKKLTKEVLAFAESGKTQFSPNDLAQALYSIESAGIHGAKAMDTLRASSKLATVGQSDLASTTKALAAAQKTGIKGSQDLKKAIGTLNASVGQGQMHMDDLVSAMGTGFLSTAAQMGLSLKDVGGALAELTKQGMPATQSATRLRMTFSLMAAPTAAAADALKTIGINADDLANTMRNQGLLPALQLLQKHLDGLSKTAQTQVLSAAFGGGRTSAAILALVNNTGDLDTILKNIKKHSGEVGKSFKEMQKEPSVRLERVWSQLQAVLIRLGNKLLPKLIPLVKQVANVAETMINAFLKAPSWLQKFLIGAIVAGPIVRMAGAMASMVGSATKLGGTLLAKFGVGSFAARGSTPANPVFVSQVGGVPGGGVPGGPVVPAALTGGELATGAALAGTGVGTVILAQELSGGAALKGLQPSNLFGSNKINPATANAQQGPRPTGQITGLPPSDRTAVQKQAIANENLAKSQVDLADSARTHFSVVDDEIQGLIEKYGSLNKAGDHMSNAQKAAFVQSAKAAHASGLITRKELFKVEDAFSSSIGGIHKFTGTTASINKWSSDAVDAFQKAMNKNKDYADGADKTQKQVSNATDKQDKNVTGSYSHMASVAGKGMETLKNSTNSALKGLGVGKSIDFSTFTLQGTAGAHQRGGRIVPGKGSGDTVPAMLEPGEFVLNREAVKSLGNANLEALNRAIPRFAKGGGVKYSLPWPGGTSAFGELDRGIDVGGTGPVFAMDSGTVTKPNFNLFSNYGSATSGLVYKMDHPPKGYSPSSPYVYIYELFRPAASAHGRINAGQTLGNITGGSGIEMGWATASGQPLADALGENIAARHTLPRGLPTSISLQNFIRDIQSGKHIAGGAAAIAKIKRQIIKGPKGALGGAAQMALDHVWHGANAFLAKQAPKKTVGGVGSVSTAGIKGPLASEAAQIAERLHAPGRAALALFEALIAESGMGTTSSNVLQLIPSTAAAAGISQSDAKGQIASFLTNAYGFGPGAISLAKSTNEPAYMIAQDVQQSGAGQATHGASNYGVQQGAASALLSRYRYPGFKDGGTVPGPIGRPMAAVVHGGETITPANEKKRYAITITNWKQGTGYMEEIADGAVNGQRRLGNQLSRMSRA